MVTLLQLLRRLRRVLRVVSCVREALVLLVRRRRQGRLLQMLELHLLLEMMGLAVAAAAARGWVKPGGSAVRVGAGKRCVLCAVVKSSSR